MAFENFPTTTKFHEIDRVHSTPHSGLDIATPLGTEVRSQDGGFINVTCDKWLGNTVRLKLDNGDIIVYGHLSKVLVQNNQYVPPNTLLGLTGGMPGTPNCGISTAPHLHVSEYVNGQLVDPTNYLFHHQTQGNFSPFLLPVMIVLILIVIWKFKKFVLYGIGIIILLAVIFLIS